MEDWRYDLLKEDINRLRDDLIEVRTRTWKIENWQGMLPFRIWLAVCWLAILGMWTFVIAGAAGAF